MTAGVPTAARVVWTGRYPGQVPGGLDGWTTDAPALASALETADELVILDPLSFPWRSLQGRRDLPVTARLPDDLDADEVDDLLGRPLLQHLGRHDRLLDDRDDHRRALTGRHGLPAEVWLPAGGGDEGLARHLDEPAGVVEQRHLDKVAEHQLVSDLMTDLDDWLDDHPEATVELHTSATSGAPMEALRRAGRGRVRRHEPDAGGFPVPSPGCAVVWLDDGDQSAVDRIDLVRTAARRVRPGGRIVVLGFVVDRPGGPANPGVHRLVEDLAVATYGAFHVDQVRSLRLGAEPWARVVTLGGTRLGPEDDS